MPASVFRLIRRGVSLEVPRFFLKLSLTKYYKIF